MDGIGENEKRETRLLIYCPHCGQQHDVTDAVLAYFALIGRALNAKPAGHDATHDPRVTTTTWDPRMAKPQ